MGCCTIGLDGLVESVLLVVADAAPNSRVNAMIHSIMGISSCLALLFPPKYGSVSTKKDLLGDFGWLIWTLQDVKRHT